MAEKRKCIKCGEETDQYTYALDNIKEDSGESRVILVCIPCKLKLGMFYKPR